jgi:hypothetical protein
MELHQPILRRVLERDFPVKEALCRVVLAVPTRSKSTAKDPQTLGYLHLSSAPRPTPFEAYQRYLPLTMYISSLITTILFATAALATPYPWAAPQGSIAPAPSGTRKHNRTHRNRHKEPTPTFKKGCECAMPVVPMNLLSANEKCLMKHAAQMGCYMSSKGGCPSPAPAVSMSVMGKKSVLTSCSAGLGRWLVCLCSRQQ